ncbi:MAG: CvpA family protein [Sphingobium sp.]
MNALDIALLLLTGGMAVTGFLRGFVEELLSLLAWVVAVVAVSFFLAPVADLTGIWMGAGAGAQTLAFAGLFGITFLIGKLIAKRAGQGMRTSVLGSVDRILGAGFGIVKGVLVATVLFLGFSLAYNLLYSVNAKRPEWMADARSYPLLKASGDAMSRLARERMEQDEGAADGASQS